MVAVPHRQPVLLAKQLASLDVSSEERLIVGVGVGQSSVEPRPGLERCADFQNCCGPVIGGDGVCPGEDCQIREVVAVSAE